MTILGVTDRLVAGKLSRFDRKTHGKIDFFLWLIFVLLISVFTRESLKRRRNEINKPRST